MKKNTDRQGRWRQKIVAFRVSQEEDEVLEAKVRLTGMTKQDYIISRLLGREIVVHGNPKVYKALKDQMEMIYRELKRLDDGTEVNKDLLEVIHVIADIMEGLKDEG